MSKYLDEYICYILVILLSTSILSNFLPLIVKSWEGYNENVRVKIEPPSLRVGGEPFTVSITISEVTKLNGWQIYLKFDPTILKGIGAFLPSGHVFEGKSLQTISPVIDNREGTVLYGCTLLSEDNFNGSGRLCQIKFQAINNGTSTLSFLGYTPPQIPTDTYLLRQKLLPWENPAQTYYIIGYDPEYENPPIYEEASITAEEVIPKEPSTISIKVNPTVIYASQYITISGDINPPKSNVDVTIYKENDVLTIVKTDNNGHYEYLWKTISSENQKESDVGTYPVKSKWDGDATHYGNESNPITVTVKDVNATFYLGRLLKKSPSETVYLQDFQRGAISFGDIKTALETPYNYTLYVFVCNVSDIYAWQIGLHISDINIANCSRESIWIPQNCVFAETGDLTRDIKSYGSSLDIIINVTQKQPHPPYSINGSKVGILCAITFTSNDIGVAAIHWLPKDTFLKRADGTIAPNKFEILHTSIEIAGTSKKKDTSISLDVNPSTVKIFKNVTISGTIDPARPYVNVTIKKDGVDMAKVTTDSKGYYEYIWLTNQTGEFKIRAVWYGDKEYKGASSPEKIVTVLEEEPIMDYTPYLLGAVYFVALVGVIVYFKKFRQPEEFESA